MIMEKFKFYKDNQISVWYRDTFVIEADSYEEAQNKAKSYVDECWENAEIRGESPVVSSEVLWNTAEHLNAFDVGSPTARILNDGEEVIAENYGDY